MVPTNSRVWCPRKAGGYKHDFNLCAVRFRRSPRQFHHHTSPARKCVPEIDTRGWVYTFDRDYHPERLCLAGWGFLAKFDLSLACGADCGPVAPTWSVSPACSRIFPGTGRLPGDAIGGVLLHSAAFARNGRAQGGFGRSGAGKSTSSRFALNAGWEGAVGPTTYETPYPIATRVLQQVGPRRGPNRLGAGTTWVRAWLSEAYSGWTAYPISTNLLDTQSAETGRFCRPGFLFAKLIVEEPCRLFPPVSAFVPISRRQIADEGIVLRQQAEVLVLNEVGVRVVALDEGLAPPKHRRPPDPGLTPIPDVLRSMLLPASAWRNSRRRCH